MFYKAAARTASSALRLCRDLIGPPTPTMMLMWPDITPVGYYNGLNLTTNPVVNTAPNQNFYGVYDLSGNVAEWGNDPFTMATSTCGPRRDWGSLHRRSAPPAAPTRCPPLPVLHQHRLPDRHGVNPRPQPTRRTLRFAITGIPVPTFTGTLHTITVTAPAGREVTDYVA
jgi:hypothetical protein